MSASRIEIDADAPDPTRREFVGGAASLGVASTMPAVALAAAASAPPTAVLVNEDALRQRFPHDAVSLLEAVARFCRRQNGEVVRIDGGQSASAIKDRVRRLARRPRRLVIFGDESCIPRFAVKAPGIELQIDWFYGDLDADGLSEVAIARVLGSPRAMMNQIGELPAESYRGRLITYSGPEFVGEVREIAPGEWIENNEHGTNRFRTASQTEREIVLDNVANGIEFKLDLAGRKTFWRRRGRSDDWQHNYDLVEATARESEQTTAGLYKSIVFRRHEGPVTDFGSVRRTASDRWIEIHREAINRYQQVSETESQLVLYNPANNVQFRLDIAARKCFWRHGSVEAWKPNYDIVAIETSKASGPSDFVAAIPAVVYAGSPQAHLESNLLATLMGDLGCEFENKELPDLLSLARAEVIYFCGHGNPQGWYGGLAGTIVTTPFVPVLRGRPVVYAGACSTAVPGAPILRAFMERGCRVYIGAASDAYGFTPAANGNELMIHLIDEIRAEPTRPIAELVAQARNRYVRDNQLAPVMLALERRESVRPDPVKAHTALQWMVFGDVTAAHPRSTPRAVYSSLSFESNPVSVGSGSSISRRLDIGAADGLPTLLFRADWDPDVSGRLEIDVVQNGETMHRLDWREAREYWAFTEGQAGGHWEAGRYRAFAVLPLTRFPGANEVTLHVRQASKPVVIRSDTAVQKWPKRPSPRLPAPRLARTGGSNLLWLCRDDDLGPMRGALKSIPRLNHLEQRDFGNRLAVFEFPGEPEHLLDLSDFDAILIDDVDSGYRAFPRGMGEKVREFVKAGGGLIMAGGHDSFNGVFAFISQGGYGGTPVEEALPVRMIKAHDCFEGRTTVSLVDARHPVTAGLATAFPAIFGYNQVAAKPGSQVLARTASGEPLLVVGQYGKGRVAALMTRTNRDWGAEFKTWARYNQFWGNLVRWTVGA